MRQKKWRSFTGHAGCGTAFQGTEEGRSVIDISSHAIKAGPKLWGRDFILIFFSTIVTFFGFHSLLTTLSIYIKDLPGGSTGIAGLGVAAVTVSAVIIRPITGVVLDRYGRKTVLILGLILFLIPCVFFNFMLPIIPLLLFRFVQGLGWGITNTSQGTIASDVIPPNRLGEGMGYFTMANGISYAISPVIALWLVYQYSFESLFIVCTITTVVALVAALMVRCPKHEAAPSTAKPIFFEKKTFRPSGVMLLVTITFGAVLSFLALYVAEQGLPNAGLYFTMMAIAIVVSRPIAGVIVDQKGRIGCDILVVFGIATVLVSTIFLGSLSTIWTLALAGLFFGLGFGVLQPTLMTICIKSVADKKGAANAAFMTAFDIGVASGSIVGGIVAEYFGYSMMFYLTAIPPALALFVNFINRGNSYDEIFLAKEAPVKDPVAYEAT